MKRTSAISILAAFILLTAAVTSAKAETRTITAEHTCVLGDNESKAQGRKICYLEAKRKILEKAGTIVVADTEIRDMQVARDVVRTYAAAKMRIKVVEEEFFVRGENFAVRTVLSAEVDMRDFDTTLEMMRESPGDASAARERALRMRRLEDRALDLREKIAAEDGPDAVAYLSEQQQIFRTLEEIEALSDAITADMQRTGRLARQYVKRGMTEGEVISLLGKPRAAKENDNMPSTWRCLNYGEVWVVFRNGLVECMRDELRYEKRYGSDCHCAGFAGEVFTN
jgi:hypothetical protein